MKSRVSHKNEKELYFLSEERAVSLSQKFFKSCLEAAFSQDVFFRKKYEDIVTANIYPLFYADVMCHKT